MLSISSVEFFDDIHAFDDLTEGREACFAIVASGVVAEIDIDLSGPRVWASVGKGDVARGVVLFQRIIGDGDVALLLRNLRIAVEPNCTLRPGTTRKNRESS